MATMLTGRAPWRRGKGQGPGQPRVGWGVLSSEGGHSRSCCQCPGPGCSHRPPARAGGLVFVLPPAGDRPRQKAEMHAASCRGWGPGKSEDASKGESHKGQHNPEMVKFIPKREFPPAPLLRTLVFPWEPPPPFSCSSSHLRTERNLETALLPPILKWELTLSYVYHYPPSLHSTELDKTPRQPRPRCPTPQAPGPRPSRTAPESQAGRARVAPPHPGHLQRTNKRDWT